MTKSSGLGMGFDIDGIDLSGDVNSFSKIGGGLGGTQEMTGIDKFAYERAGLARTGGIDWRSYFNPSAGAAHPKLSALSTADQIATVRFAPQAIGGGGAGHVCKQLNYDWNRGDDGALLLDVKTLCNGFGLEYGQYLTAGKRTDGAATNGTSYDYGAITGTTAFGLQMYVQLYAFTGTSVTIKVQSSTDDAVGDPYADVTGATTGALSAVGAVRIATGPTASVERWLRVSTVGTFSNAVFSVLVCRNIVATVF
jgi:hypothetical protein